MSDERKPCPFCGGGSSGGETNDGGRFIECVECGSSTNLRYATDDDPWPLLVEAWNRRPAADESAKPVEDRLRRLMGTVNAYEKATGIGGWYAENIQEQCNGLLKALGSAVRFGLGSENPIEAEPASKEAVTLSDAAQDVTAERVRQVTAEGWTPEHDDEHDDCEMALAAIVYAESAVGYHIECPDTWPWSPKWFKPTTPRRDLVKAGALILAEIERIDRAAQRNTSKAEGKSS